DGQKHEMPRGVTASITQTISTAYETAETSVLRTPPPDLPSLLLRERIIYLGLPLFSDDQVKQQLGLDVTELIIAQLLYLEFDNPDKPIFFYINSTGTSWYSGEAVGFETEAFAVCDTLRYVKPPVHTICIGQAMGTAAMILSAGAKGYRAALPHASIVLHQPRSGARGQASDIQIRAREVLHNKRTMLNILAANTGHTVEELSRDSDRMTYMTAAEAKEYGLIDRVLTSRKDLPAAPPPPSL
ncbi:MAG: ATP-dependent Clp protease proteolytic subunit, partial [Cyanobacteria bacterium MAG CAR2_bin_4]|nr:ATP-dependent Clp protease proteolytic subunit [Cyanobacteria bacterium MAG CAR2_bin_4]